MYSLRMVGNVAGAYLLIWRSSLAFTEMSLHLLSQEVTPVGFMIKKSPWENPKVCQSQSSG
jgi:hypothetical protein